MFRGRYEHNLDEKNRTSIPSKFRDILQRKYEDENLILTHYDGCIWCYPAKEWDRIEKRISELPQFKKEVKAIQRIFVSAASECPVDKQGRILIPAFLRENTAMGRDIIFVGMSRRIEIWDKAKWQEEIKESQQNKDLKQSIEEVLAGCDI